MRLFLFWIPAAEASNFAPLGYMLLGAAFAVTLPIALLIRGLVRPYFGAGPSWLIALHASITGVFFTWMAFGGGAALFPLWGFGAFGVFAAAVAITPADGRFRTLGTLAVASLITIAAGGWSYRQSQMARAKWDSTYRERKDLEAFETAELLRQLPTLPDEEVVHYGKALMRRGYVPDAAGARVIADAIRAEDFGAAPWLVGLLLASAEGTKALEVVMDRTDVATLRRIAGTLAHAHASQLPALRTLLPAIQRAEARADVEGSVYLREARLKISNP